MGNMDQPGLLQIKIFQKYFKQQKRADFDEKICETLKEQYDSIPILS